MKQSFDKFLYRYLLGLALLTLATGTIVYHFVEHLAWVDSYYYSVITLTTVGYGDITPHTTAGKLFTTVYVMIGIGIITTFLSYSMRRRGQRMAKRRGISVPERDQSDRS